MPSLQLHGIEPDGSVPSFQGTLSGFGREMADHTVTFYGQVGFVRPFIGYLAAEGDIIVGSAGFKGPPQQGRAEIAYVTEPTYSGRGVATAMARALLGIVRELDSPPALFAQTLPTNLASERILTKLGFGVTAQIEHPEDGLIHEWTAGVAREDLHSDPPALTTERLRIEPLTVVDAPFVRRLVNEEGWLRFIGDRGINDDTEARAYIETGPKESYRQHGIGLMRVQVMGSGETVGICGLLRRATLEAPDLGFAFLADSTGRGYATEASRAVLEDARRRFEFDRVLAVTLEENAAARRVLAKLGFTAREFRQRNAERLLVLERSRISTS